MSRSYEMRVMVRGHKPERLGDICGALEAQWEFDPSDFPLDEMPPPAELDVSGVDHLCGGMSADEMAERLAHAVWAANGAYCGVEVWSTFLDITPPSDVYTWNAGDYQEWIEQGGPDDGQCVDRVQEADREPGP
jgi:hypothetical protein